MRTWGPGVLEVRGLTVTYGGHAAVRAVDFDVGPSECVALLGPNGAGKSTTLRALSQLVRSTGSVRFDGADIQGKEADRVARLGLTHVPEGRRIFPTLTVLENLQTGLAARAGRPAAFTIDEVFDLFAPLGTLRDRLGWALSGGEQQMAAIGRGLVASPRLLMLDEPSLGLAPIVTDIVYGALEQIRQRTSMVIVEQDTTMALDLADRACVLRHGEIVMSGTTEEIADREQMLSAYLGSEDPTVD